MNIYQSLVFLHLVVWWISKKPFAVTSPLICVRFVLDLLRFSFSLVSLMGLWHHPPTLCPLFFFMSPAHVMTILSSSWDFPISLKLLSKKKAIGPYLVFLLFIGIGEFCEMCLSIFLFFSILKHSYVLIVYLQLSYAIW